MIERLITLMNRWCVSFARHTLREQVRNRRFLMIADVTIHTILNIFPRGSNPVFDLGR